MADALNYLHLQQDPIVHRDVSSSNILLQSLPNDYYRAKLSDFGSANLLRYATTPGPRAALYIAPEVFSCERQSISMDVYILLWNTDLRSNNQQIGRQIHFPQNDEHTGTTLHTHLPTSEVLYPTPSKHTTSHVMCTRSTKSLHIHTVVYTHAHIFINIIIHLLLLLLKEPVTRGGREEGYLMKQATPENFLYIVNYRISISS